MSVYCDGGRGLKGWRKVEMVYFFIFYGLWVIVLASFAFIPFFECLFSSTGVKQTPGRIYFFGKCGNL